MYTEVKESNKRKIGEVDGGGKKEKDDMPCRLCSGFEDYYFREKYQYFSPTRKIFFSVNLKHV